MLDIEPARAMHVGDDYEADVLGAKQGGVLPVLMDRTDRYQNINCLKLSDLTGVLNLLARNP